MNMHKMEEILQQGYGLVTVPRCDDSRGSLCFAEWHHLPFEPKRVFWIFDVPAEARRGGHSHETCAEVVFAVQGSFDMTVDTVKHRCTFHMDRPDTGIYIGPGTWCELSAFQPGTVCVVVASDLYDPEGYVNDYETYKLMHQ